MPNPKQILPYCLQSAAARRANVTKAAVGYWIRTGKLSYFELECGEKVISLEDLDAFIIRWKAEKAKRPSKPKRIIRRR